MGDFKSQIPIQDVCSGVRREGRLDAEKLRRFFARLG
jgi:hypothetical protein